MIELLSGSLLPNAVYMAMVMYRKEHLVFTT